MPATDQYWRNLSTMHKVFAVSAFALFAATIVMMADDQQRDWKKYQRVAEDLRVEKLQSELASYQSEEFQQQVAELEQQIEAASQDVEQNADRVAELQAELSELTGRIELLARESKFQNARRDVARANYDIGVRDQIAEDELQQLLDRFEAEQSKAEEYALNLEQVVGRQDEIRSELSLLYEKRDEAAAEKKKLEADRDRLAEQIDSLRPESPLVSAKRAFKQWPIIDGFAPIYKINQEWLPDLPVQLGMTSVARFDRCRTCHVNINEFAAGNVPVYPHGSFGNDEYPHPYSSHPNPDLYLTATSPHPINDFGCTICHDGDGSGTSFQNAEHTPDNPVVAEEWHKEYGWHSNHFWEYPMQTGQFIESSCLKCHHNVVELGVNEKYGASAPKLFEGYNLIREYGCFGCHEINGYDGTRPIGPDLRLEPQTPEEIAKYASDPNQIPGRMRKVGPSLRHIAEKTTPEFVAYWTEEPKRFRPSTRMPQFFDLTNQQDDLAHDLQPVELAGIAAYLQQSSQPFELLEPKEGYTPDPERGKKFFGERGCLACHSYDDKAFAGVTADFGPNLTKVHEKLLPGEKGFHWLYTWIREPERYHPRTKMPNLYLTPEGEGDSYVDPAADIAAFLLQGGPKEFPEPTYSEDALNELVRLYLSKAMSTDEAARTLEQRYLDRPRNEISSDEIELARASDDETVDADTWEHRKLVYVGRRTISRYGCFGCHDIPGFEDARPIGIALQDWGRKDTSKLAPEHIEEWLHHHGEPDGSSTHERVEGILADAKANGQADPQDLVTAYFYESLLHHGRDGFLWQKLRQPRSYDYMKTETKLGWDERLRMPRFPFNDEQIEAIATFVLGLVADPPPEEYIYQPTGRALDRIEGERLITKYNCAGCHVLDMPQITHAFDPDNFPSPGKGSDEFEEAFDLLLKLKPPHKAETGETDAEGRPIVRWHGMIFGPPDPDDDFEDQEYAFDTWETVQVGEEIYAPGSRILVPAPDLVSITEGRGGEFAHWLVPQLMESRFDNNRYMAWQASPPPLYREGIKVQTPWLYRFLKNPEQIRYTTVLRMPRFNMSDEEAMSLANYFASVDDVPYPYQRIEEQEPAYLATRNAEYHEEFPAEASEDYLDTAWKVLNAPLCIKCHAVGGQEYRSLNPEKDIRGPNLQRVERRLRPEWLQVWIYKPKWITPYTSMPVNFPNRPQKQLPELFGGSALWHNEAAADALLNYYWLMEHIGEMPYNPETAQETSAPQAGADGN
ncbi:MAG: c-type cytochrome [Maioricimonas sp. JB045]|uniref:c-type cytochrome n=1 Tax=Maioricimonas sp. JC845 TaxID=3232138 RepID=UPI00345B1223